MMAKIYKDNIEIDKRYTSILESDHDYIKTIKREHRDYVGLFRIEFYKFKPWELSPFLFKTVHIKNI